MKIHMLLAAFIFPVAIMYPVTGALYTWGVKGSYNTETYDINLEKPLQNDLPLLIDRVKSELMQRDIPHPEGKAKIKTAGSSFQLEWTGSNLDVILEPSPKPLIAKLKIKQTSWYRQLVQLHKAKGGNAFKVYAVILASALLTLLMTGFLMAWQIPKNRTLVLTSMSTGIILFIGMVLTS